MRWFLLGQIKCKVVGNNIYGTVLVGNNIYGTVHTSHCSKPRFEKMHLQWMVHYVTPNLLCIKKELENRLPKIATLCTIGP